MRALALFLVGILLGGYGAITQSQRLLIAGHVVPTGLVLTLAVLVPIARAGAWWMESRLGAVCVAAGWLIATLAMATSSPWGDLLLDAGTRQMVYLIGGSLLLAAACTVPLGLGSTTAPAPARGTADLDGNADVDA